jgi:hypothetical protein
MARVLKGATIQADEKQIGSPPALPGYGCCDLSQEAAVAEKIFVANCLEVSG